jgi:hypothetical protein
MFVTAHLLRKAAPQARGRRPLSSADARLVKLLACVALEIIRAGGVRANRIRAAAVRAGYVDPGELELVYFVVDRALPKHLGYDLSVLDTDYRSFAEHYLYPNRAKWAREVQALLGVPGAVERLIG